MAPIKYKKKSRARYPAIELFTLLSLQDPNPKQKMIGIKDRYVNIDRFYQSKGAKSIVVNYFKRSIIIV